MDWFKNLNAAPRLLSFDLLIMLIAAISCLAIINLSQANDQIKGLIQNSLQKVEKGSELVNRSGATLQGIVASVKRVTEIVGEIAVASSGQSAGIEQVNTVVTQMDHVTQSNSAQTEELSATAQTLSGQAARLTQLVGRFKLENY